MTEPERPNVGSEEGGLFGKLPSTRPGVRSPRRDSGKPARGPKRAGPASPPKAAAPPKPAASVRPERPPTPRTGPSAPPPRRQPPAPGPEDGEERGEAPGVEDLAWAGITVAAEAATLGVRLLSRAVDAVRKPPPG